MKNVLKLFSIIVFSFVMMTDYSFASITNGTVDTTYHYAWGENVGFVDFANITISDSALEGFIYGENIGWIDLSTVTNTTEGILEGYAWGENVGWVDFSKASIGTDGIFTGGAYGENIGWITFGTTSNKVLTDWRPFSVRPVARHSSGGYRKSPIIPVITQQITPLTNTNTLNTPTLTRILQYNMKGDDIKKLQVYLNTNGYPVSLTGAGSLNHETDYFGLKTKQALIKFQKANNLKPDGIVGPLTKALLK
jgi:hypothetical protein